MGMYCHYVEILTTNAGWIKVGSYLVRSTAVAKAKEIEQTYEGVKTRVT